MIFIYVFYSTISLYPKMSWWVLSVLVHASESIYLHLFQARMVFYLLNPAAITMQQHQSKCETGCRGLTHLYEWVSSAARMPWLESRAQWGHESKYLEPRFAPTAGRITCIGLKPESSHVRCSMHKSEGGSVCHSFDFCDRAAWKDKAFTASQQKWIRTGCQSDLEECAGQARTTNLSLHV